MTRIDPSIITHKLQVDPDHVPVKQKRKKFVTGRNKIIDVEVRKLVEARAVVEIRYPDWLANVVLRKRMGKITCASILRI